MNAQPAPGRRRRPEAVVQREILNFFLSIGWAVIRINGLKSRTSAGGYITSYICYPGALTDGCADLIAIAPNGKRTLFIEVKAEGGTQRDTQKRFEAWCKHFHLEYRLVSDVVELYDLMPINNEEIN